MPQTPADYEDCLAGEPVSDLMFGSSGTAGGWLRDQPSTAQRVHGFTVGLVLDSGTEPLEALADASLTVRAQPARQSSG